MNTFKRFLVLVSPLVLGFLFLANTTAVYAYANPAAVDLLTVTNFAALAASSVTSPTGPTKLNNGDLGIASPGTCTDFPAPCSAPNVNGTIVGGSLQYQNTAATTAETDATSVVSNLNGRSSNATTLAQLGGQVLSQGVYDVPAGVTNLTGDLTLNGDANSIFIFRAASTLITDSGSRVLLTGGAQACNVFWTVGSSATFNGTTTMVGTVFAQASISFPGGAATLDGRAIAQTAAITFNNTTVNKPTCAAAVVAASSNPSSTTTTTSSTSVSQSTSCVANYDLTNTPAILEIRRVSPTSIFLSWGPYSGHDSYNIRYGSSDGQWQYNYDVTGFSTTVTSLPANQPFWFQVAERNNCTIGSYSPSKTTGGFSGGPRLPNTGMAPRAVNAFWAITESFYLWINQLKSVFSSSR